MVIAPVQKHLLECTVRTMKTTPLWIQGEVGGVPHHAGGRGATPCRWAGCHTCRPCHSQQCWPQPVPAVRCESGRSLHRGKASVPTGLRQGQRTHMPSVDKIRYMKSVCVGAHTILVREDTGLAERVLHLRKSNGPPHRTLTTQPTVLGALPHSTGSRWLTPQHKQSVAHHTAQAVGDSPHRCRRKGL